MEKYDLVVIGAGPSGYAAAMRALDFKKKTLLIEKDNVGGAGVTNGALSSKTWWELSRKVASRKNLKKFNIQVPDVNYCEIQQEVKNAMLEGKGMLEDHLLQMQNSRHAHLLTFATGTARLLSQNKIEISSDEGKKAVWADYIVPATLWIALLLFSSQFATAQLNMRQKKTTYEEVDLENVMKRYFGKSFGYSIEGIYSVSCVITKRNKKFLSKAERIRVVARQDNYAKVAIMKDWPDSKRDFIEVSLSYRKANSFPIMGELNTMADGRGYIYTHFEPGGGHYTFSMLESDGLLEAEYSSMEKRTTVTYRLSYLKIYPTGKEDLTVYDYR